MSRKRLNSRMPNWKWFAVKLLFECVICGEPSSDTLDRNYSGDIKTFEESIFLIRAQSFEQAYKIAEKKAKAAEINYDNPYGQTVSWKLIESLDAFELFDEVLISGTELYSRYIHVPKEIENSKVVSSFYPETISSDEDQADFNWLPRNKD